MFTRDATTVERVPLRCFTFVEADFTRDFVNLKCLYDLQNSSVLLGFMTRDVYVVYIQLFETRLRRLYGAICNVVTCTVTQIEISCIEPMPRFDYV